MKKQDGIPDDPLRDCDGKIKNVMIKINGQSFRCDCGCNVFHHPQKHDLKQYRCNSCEAKYIGETP